FSWLSEQAGMPVVVQNKPTGTFTFVPPKGNKGYTLGEIIDIVNEALMAKQYLLIRRPHSFVVVPGDEKIDPLLAPRGRVEELKQLGRTQLVSVVFPLRALKAEEVAADVKRMFGPFGELIALRTSNQLILQDTAGNLARVCEALRDMDTAAAKGKDRQ